MSYLGSTWVGTCVGSTLGSVYAVVVLATMGGGVGVEGVFGTFLFGTVVSFVVLLGGSLLIGQFLARWLSRVPGWRRVLVFAEVGCACGIVAAVVFIGWAASIGVSISASMSAWERGVFLTKLGSIPVCYVTVAAVVAALVLNADEGKSRGEGVGETS